MLSAVGILFCIAEYFDYVKRFIMWWPSPKNKLIKNSAGNKVYLVQNNSTKRWIKNPPILYELGYDLDNIYPVLPNEVNGYIEKGSILI